MTSDNEKIKYWLVYQPHADGSLYPTIEYTRSTSGSGKTSDREAYEISESDLSLPFSTLIVKYPSTRKIHQHDKAS